MNKHSVFRFGRIVALSFMLLASAVKATTLVATVNGMVCAFCAQGIEKKLRALNSTQDVYVNLGQKVVAAQIKEGRSMDEAAFRALIVDAGYDVAALQTVEKTAAQVKAEMKAKK